MLAKRVGILIRKTQMTTINKIVWEHDIPVLNAKFGAANITKYKVPRFITLNPKESQVQRGFMRWPITEVDHNSEYNRLATTYGKDEETKQQWVERAYGFPEEHRMETLADAKYKALIAAGHTVMKTPKIPEEQYDDGLVVFELEDLEPEPPAPPAPAGMISNPQNSDTPAQKTYANPLTDTETMFKKENMTKEGIIELLDNRGIEFSTESNKDELHELFMNSMKPVGVDPEIEE